MRLMIIRVTSNMILSQSSGAQHKKTTHKDLRNLKQHNVLDRF